MAHWQVNGCGHGHSRGEAKRGIRSIYTSTRPYSKARGKRVRHFIRCVRSPKTQSDLQRYAKRLSRWRKRNAWYIRFKRMPAYEQAWARSTGACESGNRSSAHSPNGDHGAMQFKLATAYAAGFSTDPHNTSLYEQYVRAIRWKWRTSDEQWPNCGD